MAKFKSVKITVVGDAYSEKTRVLNYYTTRNYSDYIPTVFDNYSEIKQLDGIFYHIKLWDTAGQEDYDQLRPLSYPHTTCFLLLFAIDDVRSLENVLFKWLPEVREYMPETPCILVGTKGEKRCDVADADKLISAQNITQVIRSVKAADYFECSAKMGTGIDELIDAAIRCSHKKRAHVCKRKIAEFSQFISKMKGWIVVKLRERAVQISQPERKKETAIENDYYLR